MKILVTGDRNYTNIERIHEVLSSYPQDTILVHGGAKGADSIAHVIAEELGWPAPRVYKALWSKYGKAAGPIRNREMFDTEQPDRVLAFHDDYKNSKGTKDMVGYAGGKGCPCGIYDKNSFTTIGMTFYNIPLPANTPII